MKTHDPMIDALRADFCRLSGKAPRCVRVAPIVREGARGYAILPARNLSGFLYWLERDFPKLTRRTRKRFVNAWGSFCLRHVNPWE